MSVIRDLGPEHCFISSDSGLVNRANHTDALVKTIRVLREGGFSEEELSLMFRDNPAKLIGLPPL
jgi:predicted metal-dependent phosphotriesterase family hydrolase